jgi:predicted nuclease with TOPRIM domain
MLHAIILLRLLKNDYHKLKATNQELSDSIESLSEELKRSKKEQNKMEERIRKDKEKLKILKEMLAQREQELEGYHKRREEYLAKVQAKDHVRCLYKCIELNILITIANS